MAYIVRLFTEDYQNMSSHRRKTKLSPCHPDMAAEPLTTLEQIVDHYIHYWRPCVSQELRFYATQPSLTAAIEVAALARTPAGKRHSHQYRIPAKRLQEAMEQLMNVIDELHACGSFHELFCVVERTIEPIPGIGELTVYDTALHIGAYLGLAPEQVYIHRGARTGLENMGLNGGEKVVSPKRFPPPFARLEPREIEDCLCIYKKKLANCRTV